MNLTSEHLSRKAGGALSALALANLALQTLLTGAAVAAPTPGSLGGSAGGSALDLVEAAAPAAAAAQAEAGEGVELAQNWATTLAVGEEGAQNFTPRHPNWNRPAPRPPGWGDATTLAVGEEGGGWNRPAPRPPGWGATTYAVGEEGGGIHRPAPRPPGWGATTYAFGEEGGGGWTPNRPTTMALGEENPHRPPPRHWR
ncbi:hypothetical protein [Neomegalonema perideroedes]|uniref:hypothetical protein n=1 Tax=Neomegalonema perideroedes TaxID=217219 RepID=UPI00039D9B65|nr:hypothetical protein [Neomegalonema perideroedes]